MSLVCSSSTRCGRPCDYAATGFCSWWRSHSACCAEDRSFHGAVLGWSSTRPLVCKRAENCGFRRCSALTRCGRPCDYAVTQSRSGRCHRYSSSPDLVDIPVCTETGFAVGCDDGFFDAFCVIFRTEPSTTKSSSLSRVGEVALTPGAGVGPPRVACQLVDSHDVDIHMVKESVKNNNNTP